MLQEIPNAIENGVEVGDRRIAHASHADDTRTPFQNSWSLGLPTYLVTCQIRDLSSYGDGLVTIAERRQASRPRWGKRVRESGEERKEGERGDVRGGGLWVDFGSSR